MRQIRGTVGANREAWRIATQAEVDSLRDNGSYAEASSAELKKPNYRDILPTKLATGAKRDANPAAAKYKARAVVCGNVQRKAEMMIYTPQTPTPPVFGRSSRQLRSDTTVRTYWAPTQHS